MGEVNNRIENYLNLVCSYIKNKDVHKEVSDEIKEHIYEIYEEGIENGLSENAAIDNAIKRMGDTYTLGNNLNKIHRAKPDYISFIGVIFLGIIGLITMYTIQNADIVSYNMTGKSLIAICIGIVIAIGLYYFDYRKLQKYSFHIYFLSILITILAWSTSHLVNGRPSNMATVSLIVTVGFLVSLSGLINKLDLNKFKNIVLILFMGFVPFAILILIPSLTLSIFYAIAFNCIFILSNIKLKYKKVGLLSEGIVAIGTYILCILPYSFRIYRAFPFLSPQDDLTYTYIESMKLIKGAGLFGNDISAFKSGLPEMHTDFAFPAMVYSLGWIITFIVLIVIAVFVVRNLMLVKKVKNNFGKSIVLSCTMILFLQFATVILSALGFTNVLYTMPFISYGVGNLISNFIILGLLMSVYRRKSLRSFNEGII